MKCVSSNFAQIHCSAALQQFLPTIFQYYAEKINNVNVDIQQLKPDVYTASISNGINLVSKTFIKNN